MKTKMPKASRNCSSASCRGGNAVAAFALQVSNGLFSNWSGTCVERLATSERRFSANPTYHSRLGGGPLAALYEWRGQTMAVSRRCLRTSRKGPFVQQSRIPHPFGVRISGARDPACGRPPNARTPNAPVTFAPVWM
jgi:hypothetical protein